VTEQSYVVYGDKGSGSCAVECALAEAGAAFEVVPVRLEANEQSEDAYMALNPARKIPAVRFPDGSFMTESAAILIALAESEPGAGLLPTAGTAERRTALRWLAYLATEIYPQIEIRDYPERFVPVPEMADRVRDLTRERIRSRWAPVEHAAAGEGHMLASGFSVVDLYVATLSRWAIGADWRAANLLKVETIGHAVARRPRVGEVWARHFG